MMQKVHIDSYVGLDGAVKFTDEADTADAVVVVQRGNKVTYVNRQEDGDEARGQRRRRWRARGGSY
jgi:hypothetical protein